MKSIKKSYTKLVLGVFSTLVIFSCSSPKEESYQEETIDAEVEVEDNRAQQVFYSLPSPFELASLLRNSGAKFDKDILNSSENISKYTTSTSKAVNLGIYGADLSYSSIFGQTQSTVVYLNCVRKLVEELGISNAFDEQSMKRLEKNKANDDSLQQIVAEAYLIANSYLKDNDRVNMATFILAGGLIEGLHIATQLIKQGNSVEGLSEMVVDQKFSLENLIAMLEGFGDNDAKLMLASLHELMEVYNQVEENETAETKITTDNKTNTTVIGGDAELSVNAEQIKAISEKVSTIRAKFIN